MSDARSTARASQVTWKSSVCTVSPLCLFPFLIQRMQHLGPTPREVVIALLCLVTVLYFSTSAPSHHQITTVPAPHADPAPSTFLKPVEETNQRHWETQISWRTTPPSTRLVAHVPGWTVFDRLYLFQGVLYVVSDEPETLPTVEAMISAGEWIENGREAELARLPTDKDMQIISTKEAAKLFGSRAQIIEGVNVRSCFYFSLIGMHLCSALAAV